MNRDTLRRLAQRIANGYGPEAFRKGKPKQEVKAESIPQEAKRVGKVADHAALEAIQRTLGSERIIEAKRDYVPKAQAKVPGRCKKARL